MYFFYPLMTTAECPNLLSSLWRFGFGNIFHSSQARKERSEKQKIKKQINTNTKKQSGQINDTIHKVRKPFINFSWPTI